MRDNKHKKRAAAGRRSIDGIVSDSRRLGVPSATPFHPHQRQQADSLGGNLRRDEGFHPMRSGSGSLGVVAATAETNLLLDEPIVLDEQSVGETKGKTGLRHRLPKIGLKKAALAILALFLVMGLY